MLVETDSGMWAFPLLLIFWWAFGIFREYVSWQDSISQRVATRCAPYLAKIPTHLKTLSNFLGSTSFYTMAGLGLVCSFECHNTAFYVAAFCMMEVVGLFFKSLLSTKPSQGSQPIWPSKSAIHAMWLPFLVLRSGSGMQWVQSSYISALVAFVWVCTICIGRLASGDSPANIQGGLLIGTVGTHVLILIRDHTTTHAWLENGEISIANPFIITMCLAMALFPLPVISGESGLVEAGKTYYMKAAGMLSFMFSFMYGTTLCPPPESVPTRDTFTTLVRTFVGILALMVTIPIVTKVIMSLARRIVGMCTECIIPFAYLFTLATTILRSSVTGAIVSVAIPSIVQAVA